MICEEDKGWQGNSAATETRYSTHYKSSTDLRIAKCWHIQKTLSMQSNMHYVALVKALNFDKEARRMTKTSREED